MPCKHEKHDHSAAWVTEGTLIIERCEKICGLCGYNAKHAWHNRRHVEQVHCKQYPNLVVSECWHDADGNLVSNSKAGFKNKSGGKEPDGTPVGPKDRKVKKKQQRKITTAAPVTPPPQQRLPAIDSGVWYDGSAMQSPHRSPFTGSGSSSVSFTCPPPPLHLECASDLPSLAMDLPSHSMDLQALDPALFGGEADNWAATPVLGGFDMTAMDDALFSSGSTDTTPWSSPQKVRSTGTAIESIKPHVVNGFASDAIIDGLNDILMPSATILADSEKLYILEKLTAAFKNGTSYSMY